MKQPALYTARVFNSLVLTRFKSLPLIATSLIVLFSGGSLVVSTPLALAASHTLYVGHGTTDPSDSSCSLPGYSSVQSAVNAAVAGDSVYLCGAQFSEQVFVKKAITLTGDPGSGLTAVGTTFSTSKSDYPAKFTSDSLFLPQALLVTTSNVMVKYLTFSGPMSSTFTCAKQEFGVLALSGSLNMFDDQVLNIADSDSGLYGCQFGVGIQVGREYWPNATYSSFVTANFAAQANLNDVTVSGYQKNGITIDGTGSKAMVQDSTVTGGGSGAPFGTIIAQNGIQISRGASGEVKDNTVSDNAYSGAGDASATGIYLYGGAGDPVVKNVNVHGNTLKNNDVGIAMTNFNADGSGATATKTNDKAFDNELSNSAVTNVSGLCDGFGACPGVGYQAGIQDIGNSDSVKFNMITGAGYASQGTYTYTALSPVFTQTGPNHAFVRPVDAGGADGSFYDTNPTVNDNMFY